MLRDPARSTSTDRRPCATLRWTRGPSRIAFIPRRSRRALRHFVAIGSPELQRFVRRTLADIAGLADPPPARLAAAFATLCGGLHKQLEPLFGKQAVAALFARALHMAASEHPWLTEV